MSLQPPKCFPLWFILCLFPSVEPAVALPDRKQSLLRVCQKRICRQHFSARHESSSSVSVIRRIQRRNEWHSVRKAFIEIEFSKEEFGSNTINLSSNIIREAELCIHVLESHTVANDFRAQRWTRENRDNWNLYYCLKTLKCSWFQALSQADSPWKSPN